MKSEKSKQNCKQAWGGLEQLFHKELRSQQPRKSEDLQWVGRDLHFDTPHCYFLT